MLLASRQTIHFAINWSISWLHVKQRHSRQQQIPGNLAKQILMATLNKSEFQRLVVSHYTIIPRTHRSRKTIIRREDYQLTIIWARRLSGDNYLSGGLSLEIPRGISQLWLFFPSSYFWTIENCKSPAAINVSIQHQNYLWIGQKFALVGFHWVQYQLSIPGAKGLCSWWNIDNPTKTNSVVTMPESWLLARVQILFFIPASALVVKQSKGYPVHSTPSTILPLFDVEPIKPYAHITIAF